MGDDKRTPLLFQYASAYRFQEFDALLAQLGPGLCRQELPDVYGMRAQIKLYAAADTALADAAAASQPGLPPQFPCLNAKWLPDSANRFVVFSKAPGALDRFSGTLAQVAEHLDQLYGGPGRNMVRQVQSEILYFQGHFDKAIQLARQQLVAVPANSASVILALYVMLRSHLAGGESSEAGQCMMEIIRASRASAECLAPYRVVRSWANLTTGWSGETPRFRMESVEDPTPVLDDRLDAIRDGITRLSRLEEPFAEYARRSYEDAYVMRDFFMDVFYAIYWHQSGDLAQSDLSFAKAYRIAADSGLPMPFVEYGKQILPLLERAKGDERYDAEWLDRVSALASQYEAGLDAFRDS